MTVYSHILNISKASVSSEDCLGLGEEERGERMRADKEGKERALSQGTVKEDWGT